MAASPFNVLSKLESRIVDFVWKPLQNAYDLPTKERPSRLKLAQVKFFGALVTEAQNRGVPLWEASGGSASARTEARRVFTDFAKNVIARTA